MGLDGRSTPAFFAYTSAPRRSWFPPFIPYVRLLSPTPTSIRKLRVFRRSQQPRRQPQSHRQLAVAVPSPVAAVAARLDVVERAGPPPARARRPQRFFSTLQCVAAQCVVVVDSAAVVPAGVAERRRGARPLAQGPTPVRRAAEHAVHHTEAVHSRPQWHDVNEC